MNFFEKRAAESLQQQPHAPGRPLLRADLLGQLDEDLRVKLQLPPPAMRITMTPSNWQSSTGPMVWWTSSLFRFSDIIGQQAVEGRDPINPHIWDYNGRLEWYRPISQEQRSQIANTILDYVGMYQEETEGKRLYYETVKEVSL